MFRRHALRGASRAPRSRRPAYISMATAAGVVGSVQAAENSDSNSGNEITPVEVVVPVAQDATHGPGPEATANTSHVLEEASVAAIAQPEPPKLVFPELPEKLSIYPRATSTLVLLDTPSPLELQIGYVRRQVYGYYSDARTQVQGVIDRWIHVEQAVESRLKSFRDPAEPLNPGLLYTGVSALTASIIVRSRSLPVRFLLPPISLVGTFAYFLPRTAGRVGGWVEELEGRYAPRVGEIRRTGVAHTSMAVGMVGERYKEGREAFGKGVRSAVEGIESGTGLRLSAALGWRVETQDKKRSEESPSSEGEKKA